MPALFPMMSAAEDFRPGECVRKFVSEQSVTPFLGVVKQVVPATQKVWVQWPSETAQESPEMLIKVNPWVFGLPTILRDRGYDSYEKQVSEKLFGGRPRLAAEQMAIRIAHGFATNIVGKLVDDIIACQEEKLGELQTYNRIFHKYSNICSDHIMRFAVQRVYAPTRKS